MISAEFQMTRIKNKKSGIFVQLREKQKEKMLVGTPSTARAFSHHAKRESPISTPLHLPIVRRKLKHSSRFRCFSPRIEDIAQIAHNKVLIAAAASAALGQLSKPFTSAIFYGNSLDFRDVIQSGGFPSTHSSSVVAAATTLALERGYSDSIVGFAIVYAGLVMYDAQGVRREVGNHARLLNKIPDRRRVNSAPSEDKANLIGSQPGLSSLFLGNLGPCLSDEEGSLTPESTKASICLELEKGMRGSSRTQYSPSPGVDLEEGSKQAAYGSSLLKESVGHTEVEVIAGALLGFAVSLVMYNIL